MDDRLVSLHNVLPGDSDRAWVEINPAVVSTDGEARYALSMVCVGPAFEADRFGLALDIGHDGAAAHLEAVHHHSEMTTADDCLTVALFSVGRRLLELLASETSVVIRLGNGRVDLQRQLDSENRLNVRRFLQHLGGESSGATLGVTADAVA